jgi:predicted aldo/keto reductase-like oxidoreductase
MEQRRFGRTGIRVSELCLGTMTFGKEADDATSKSIVDRFLDAGGNFVDMRTCTGRSLRRSPGRHSAAATGSCFGPRSASDG